MKQKNGGPPAGRQGFTLAELLVYAAIFAIVAGILTTIFYVIINSEKKQSVSGEVTQQLNFVLTTVQRLVGDSSLVEAVYEGSNPLSTCTTFCTLKLRREDPSKDPTLISSDQNGIYLQEGTNPQVTLTTNKVLINHFKLTKHEVPGGHAVVEISTSFSYNTNNPTFAVTKAIESAIARVNAATFDADLLPNQDNTFDIGQIAGANLRWRNGHFSQNLTVAGKLGIGTASPNSSAILDLNSTSLGFLLPRMTTSQRDAISPPAAGLLIYNTTNSALNLYNGSSWGGVGASAPQYVTSLPGSPIDGQEVYYVASATNGVVWHLRYNAGSGSSYKWEFLGGPPLYAEITTGESTTSGSYTNLATIGPQITAPLSGDYMITISAYMTGSSFQGDVWNYMSFAVGGTAASDADSAIHLTMSYDGSPNAQENPGTPIRTSRKTGISAGAAITAKYKIAIRWGDSHSGGFARRWMTITPVRLGP